MEKVRKRGVSLFSVFLMVVLAIGLMPQFGTGGAYAVTEDSALAAGANALSSAADGDLPAMGMGMSVLGNKVNTADAQTVYMADKAWRVIGYDGTGAASAPGMATLHLSSSAKTSQF